MIARLLLFMMLASLVCAAADEASPPSETGNTARPAPTDISHLIQQLDANRYRIGDISFNRETREIRFPCEINMQEGLIEFLIVHKNGNVHESLLSTTISATHLNVAFKLLNYQASPELYALRDQNGDVTEQYPKVPEAVRQAARIRIDLEWEHEGQIRRIPVGDWIQHNVRTGESMPVGPWVYGGSEVYGGKFLPESSGNICAIFATNSALINYPGEGAFDDTLWNVYSERVPKIGTKVTAVIAPYANAKPPSTP